MSAKLASKAKFDMDFKPLTFGPFLKKTLYYHTALPPLPPAALQHEHLPAVTVRPS